MPAESPTFQCRHIKPDGNRCGSPALRREHFCYYHHTTRRPGPRQPQVRTLADRKTSTFDLPSPADLAERSGVQLAVALLLHKIAHNEIDPRRAGLLLYGLQIASTNLKAEPSRKATTQPDPVEEVTEDPNHGTLAPEIEWEKVEAAGTWTQLLRQIERMEQQEAQQEAQQQAEQDLRDQEERQHAQLAVALPKASHDNTIPLLQAKAQPTLNRACRRHLARLANSPKPRKQRRQVPKQQVPPLSTYRRGLSE